MAEFQEVMKQYNRMVEAHRKGVTIPVEASYETAVKQPDFFEEVVMEWAAENPEPVYPTWVDWLMSEGVIPTNYMAANSTDSGVRAGVFYVTSKAFEPIPADIAAKLRLKLKEE